jgi:hypothetical protein
VTFKDAIRASLRISDSLVQGYLADITPDEMFHRPVPGANHIAWQLGHLITSERNLIEAAAPGSMPALPEGFAEIYRRGKTPSDDPADYLPKEEYIQLAKQVRAATLKALDRFAEANFAKPVTARVPPFITCAGDCFATVGPHWSLHAGQWVVIRRALNRPVMF